MPASCFLLAAVTAVTLAVANPATAAAGQDQDVITLAIGAPPGPARPAQSGATLFLNALGERQRADLASALEALARALDRRRNPLFVPLDESDVQEAVDQLVRITSPALTAAAGLAAGVWRSPEGDLVVHVVRRCAAGARCIGLGDRAAGGELERRVRFFAWPVGYAIVLEMASAPEAARVADRLRAENAADSPVALVLTGGELHSLRRREQLRGVFRLARRIRGSMPEAGSALAEALANIDRASTVGDEVPWLALPTRAILIVPRLGALATAGVFVANVRQRLARAGAEARWLAAPAR